MVQSFFTSKISVVLSFWYFYIRIRTLKQFQSKLCRHIFLCAFGHIQQFSSSKTQRIGESVRWCTLTYIEQFSGTIYPCTPSSKFCQYRKTQRSIHWSMQNMDSSNSSCLERAAISLLCGPCAVNPGGCARHL